MNVEARQLEVLKAIIDEYVASQEPVGSKILAQRHSLGVSPATCLLYTSPSPRDLSTSRMPASA